MIYEMVKARIYLCSTTVFPFRRVFHCFCKSRRGKGFYLIYDYFASGLTDFGFKDKKINTKIQKQKCGALDLDSGIILQA